AHFPPAGKLITVDGRRNALDEVLVRTQLADGPELLGPVELPPGPDRGGEADDDQPTRRLPLRAPRRGGVQLARAVRDVTATRRARKSEGGLRVRVVPQTMDWARGVRRRRRRVGAAGRRSRPGWSTSARRRPARAPDRPAHGP